MKETTKDPGQNLALAQELLDEAMYGEEGRNLAPQREVTTTALPADDDEGDELPSHLEGLGLA